MGDDAVRQYSSKNRYAFRRGLRLRPGLKTIPATAQDHLPGINSYLFPVPEILF